MLNTSTTKLVQRYYFSNIQGNFDTFHDYLTNEAKHSLIGNNEFCNIESFTTEWINYALCLSSALSVL